MSLCANCGSPLPSESADCENCSTLAFLTARTAHDAPQIPGYEVIKRIGEGGMGSVYLAEERSLGRRVAIKLISGKVAKDEQMRARFMREARSLANIEHANVVRVYAFGEVGTMPYLAMEFIDGDTVSDRIRRSGKLSIEESVRIMRQVLLALEAAWEKGIVHRDIKPSNVLIDRRDQVHVADFGLAKPAGISDDPALTNSGSVLGTPYYLSPEQAQGLPTDFRSDIYSCGILFYEMLSGERPFEGTTPFAIVAKHLHEPLPSIRSRRPDVPSRVARLIDVMTEKRPERRPQSYAELIGMFDALLGITPSKGITPTTTLPAAQSAMRLDRFRTPLIAGVAGLVVIASALLIYFGPEKGKTNTARQPPSKRFIVAVAPFYGPDPDSAKEGRMMAALIERSITAKLGSGNVTVAGIDETKEPVHSHDAARALGEKLGASVVVWGEAFTLKRETEIQPYFTLVRKKEEKAAASAGESAQPAVNAADPLAEVSEKSTGITRVTAEAPNQFELRKTSAEGVGEMISFLVALHAFYERGDPNRALQLLDQAPRTVDALRLRGRALNEVAHQEDRNFRGSISGKALRAWNDAAVAFEQSLAIEPNDVQTRAELADVYLLQGRFKDAVAEYQKVAATDKPYVTHYAVASDGLIYVREVFRAEWIGSGLLDDTGYLLATNPVDGAVVRRYRIPGAIRSFKPAEGGFSVEFAAERMAAQIQSISFVKGRFDRPLTIGGNTLLRMRGMKSGRVLPQNFEDEYSGMIDTQPSHPRFRMRKRPLAGVPQTLPELDVALREAARRDPTQPWHPFFLGQTLWEEGRKPEAEAIWRDLLAREFGVIWMDYNWMAKVCQRLEQREWADRFFARARAERLRLPQPIQATTLIDRLMNVPVVRMHADQKNDPELAYSWFRRARELTGPAEGDHCYAAAWAGRFRRAGDLARARFEEQYARRAAADPLNFAAQSTIVDYAADVFLTLWFTFTAGLLFVLLRARNLARDGDDAGGFSSRSRRWVIAGVGIIGSFILGAVAGLELPGTAGAAKVWLTLGITLCAALLLAVGILTSRTVIAEVGRRERLLLLAWFVGFFVAASTFIHIVNLRVGFMAVPIGIGDSFGHPSIVSDLEKRLSAHDTPTLRYATAVANQLGGNLVRARQLYELLPGDVRARRALQALSKDEPFLAFPTQQELFASYAEPASWITFRKTVMEFEDSAFFWRGSAVMIYGGVAAGCLFFVLCLVIPPAGSGDGVRPVTGRIRRFSAQMFFVVVPGTFDLLRCSIARGLVVLAMFGFSMVSLWTVRLTAKVSHPLKSVGTASWVFPGMNLGSAAPLPPDTTAMDLVLAPPYARLFWGVSIAVAVALLVLHAMRIPQIFAIGRGDALREEPAPPPPQLSA